MIRLNGSVIEQNHFPDGTLNIKTDHLYPLQYNEQVVLEWNYESDSELFAIICLAKKYDRHYKILWMPYMPNARMDRIKNPDIEVFTLKYFCEIINSLNFNEVHIIDAHSNVTPALLNNCYNHSVDEYIYKTMNYILSDNLMLFFPDEGAMKRYSGSVAKPYAFGVKNRDWETGKILSLKIEGNVDIEGKDVLIVDDICSYGGTFVRAATALKEAGANRIFLFVAHCEANIFNGGIFTDENKRLFDTIYTLNTVPALQHRLAQEDPDSIPPIEIFNIL